MKTRPRHIRRGLEEDRIIGRIDGKRARERARHRRERERRERELRVRKALEEDECEVI